MPYYRLFLATASSIYMFNTPVFATSAERLDSQSNQYMSSSAQKSSYMDKVLSSFTGNDWSNTADLHLSSVFPYRYNNYSANTPYRSALMGGLFLGIEYWRNPMLALQLGMGGYALSAVNVSGSVLQLNHHKPSDFNYNSRLQSDRLVAESKVLSNLADNIHPYLSGSLGVAANKTYAYQGTTRFMAGITTPSLTYGLGAGIDLNLSQFLRLGVGYQYLNLGHFLLDMSRTQVGAHAQSPSNMDAHQIRLQLRALG
ncbi:MAG: outer membrane protein [Legionella sp.]